MAILKTLLEEDVLSKQERHVLRSIYRANALVEGVKSLDQFCESVRSEKSSTLSVQTELKIKAQRAWLVLQAAKALDDVRLPVSVPVGNTSSNQPVSE